jgi:anti-sigma regulatory factor (Ser/Thr protein kinase)
MSEVEVSFTALPSHVRTARLVATAVARRCGVDEESLDEVRLAVGEACSRAVGLHQRHAPDQPVKMVLGDDRGQFTVTVSDAGPAEEAPDAENGLPDLGALDVEAIAEPAGESTREPLPNPLPAGFGLAVITGLVDDVDIRTDPDAAGTVVRMRWPIGKPLASTESAAAADPELSH